MSSPYAGGGGAVGAAVSTQEQDLEGRAGSAVQRRLSELASEAFLEAIL